MNDVSQMLDAVAKGNQNAANELFPLVYSELRRIAAQQMMQEKAGQTLQPTALVHEAFLRMVGNGYKEALANRRYFFAAAAEAMRRILIEQARRKQSEKRGGLQQRIDLDSGLAVVEEPEQFTELNEALESLAKLDPRKAELVRMRYFLGLALPEIAEILAISQATAERDWSFARAWLYTRLQSTLNNSVVE